MINYRNAMERLFSSITVWMFLSSAQAATLTVDVLNESGDEIAVTQAVVALHASEANTLSENNSVVRQIEQTNSQFKPFISAVQVGSSIKFPNRDSFAHHVYSFSEPAKFQSELYSQQESHEIEVSKPGVIVVGCNIHDWMLAYVYVVDTPYFAKPKNNQVQFESIEDGEYSVSIWHPSMTSPIINTVEVAGASKTVQLRVNLKRIEQIQPPSHSFHEDDDY